MAIIRKRPLGYKIESALVNYLTKTGAFKGCAIIEKSNAKEAPEDLPCIIVTCPQTSRTEDTPPSMYAKDANVVCALYGDSEDMSEAKYGSYAQELEFRMEDLGGMQEIFNKPTSGRDSRKIRGMHLHYITEFQTDQDTEGTQWQYGVACTLSLQETLDQ